MSDQTKNEQKGSTENDQQGQFGIQKIYVKDVSFETPLSPRIFQEQWKPTVNMDIANATTSISDELYEVVLTITITVSIEGKTAYLVEVHQAGLFQIVDIPEDVLKKVLATVCPNILFPFAREFVADLIMRGGFPQLLLSPVNFDALYYQQQNKQAAKTETEQSNKTKH